MISFAAPPPSGATAPDDPWGSTPTASASRLAAVLRTGAASASGGVSASRLARTAAPSGATSANGWARPQRAGGAASASVGIPARGWDGGAAARRDAQREDHPTGVPPRRTCARAAPPARTRTRPRHRRNMCGETGTDARAASTTRPPQRCQPNRTPGDKGRPSVGSRLPTPSADGVKGSTPTASASRLARVLRTGRDLSERGERRLRDLPERLRRRARPQRTRQSRPQRTGGTTSANGGATSGGGQARPQRRPDVVRPGCGGSSDATATESGPAALGTATRTAPTRTDAPPENSAGRSTTGRSSSPARA